MLIKKFHVPLEETPRGIDEINMTRLGRVVAIAGKNGAGKSRLLRKLAELVGHRQSFRPNINNIVSELQNYSIALKSNPNSSEVPTWRREIESKKNDQRHATNFYITAFHEEELGREFKALSFVPKGTALANPDELTQQESQRRFVVATKYGIEAFNEVTLAYISNLQADYFSATHPETKDSAIEKELAIGSYNRFNDLLFILLGERVERSKAGPLLFSMPIFASGLSDGQKIILQLVTAIHAQDANLNNTVFILDELENHLHPSAAIEVLERISAAAPNAQIWLATHSIPLLAHIVSADPMALWYMEKGKISHAGRHPERVLRSLLGDDNRIGQLNNFTALPAQLAMVNYAVESLMPPGVVPAEDNDPQLNQIYEVIRGKFNNNPASILDFGAGKGRLLDGIAASMTNGDVKSYFDYFAFDEYEDNSSHCLKIISEHYTDIKKRYFNSEEDYFANAEKKSIDVVVMCNVLHEIHPKDWISLFSKGTSLLQYALKDDGYVLIVEDQRIPVGEKAHENGFLVLDTAQLITLFDINSSDKTEARFLMTERRGGRLKAHLIAKSVIARINSAQRSAAIDQLRQAALNNIKSLRTREASYENGQLHGFWTQQLANCYMYLEENPAS